MTTIKKISFLFTISLLLLTGCSMITNRTARTSPQNATTTTARPPAPAPVSAIPATPRITSTHMLIENTNAKTIVTLNNGRAQIDGLGAEFSNDTLTITTGGMYVLSGELDGQILIDATRDDVIQLVLNNIKVHNDVGPAIFAPRSQRVEIILIEDTLNTISDGPHLISGSNAAIYIQHDLLIWGCGQLFITGNYNHGLRSQGILTVNEGRINAVTTLRGDTIRGRNGVIINDGDFSLHPVRDGIRTTRVDDSERGFLTINGGNFNINSGGHAMQVRSSTAQTTITDGNFQFRSYRKGITSRGPVLISGGNFNILDSWEGIEGLNVTITGGNFYIIARDDGINARRHRSLPVTEDTIDARIESCLTDEVFIRITGGVIEIYAYGDGLDSNGNLFIDGGQVRITAPSYLMEGAIDYIGIFVLTGGEIITAGSMYTHDVRATQPIIYMRYDRLHDAGSLIEIRDASNNPVLVYESRAPFSATVFSSPLFEIGGRYYPYINDERMTGITIEEYFTYYVARTPATRARRGLFR